MPALNTVGFDAFSTQQHAGVADDSALVTADVCTRGVAGALSASQLIETFQSFHHDHSGQDSAHADVLQLDGVQLKADRSHDPAFSRLNAKRVENQIGSPPLMFKTMSRFRSNV